MVDLALRLIPCGIIGARLYYVAFTWSLFRENPIAILEIWKGGLAIYGGLIGGFLAALVFARRRKLNLLTLIDMIVPGLALAQCIGRWGNYFNMEAMDSHHKSRVSVFPHGRADPGGRHAGLAHGDVLL